MNTSTVQINEESLIEINGYEIRVKDDRIKVYKKEFFGRKLIFESEK